MKKLCVVPPGAARDPHKEIMRMWAVASQRQADGPHKACM